MSTANNLFLTDKILESKATKSSKSVSVKGMVSVENTLNSMTGDITHKELAEIPGISIAALKAKEKSGEISIFQKKDYVSSISQSGNQISYHNIALLKNFISESGRIVPGRISSLRKDQQKEVMIAIKIARFLSLIPAVQY